MPYNKLLTKVIAESGYSISYIVEKCREKGKNIDKSYLSKLQNGRVPAPAEETSRIIANVCNVDERILVIEGYIDKAPKEIKEAFLSIKISTYVAALNIFENNFDTNFLKEFEEELSKEPLSEFIISLIDNKNTNIANIKNIISDNFNIEKKDEENYNVTLTEPIALSISDNAMYPIIPENSKVTLLIQSKYENGDILALKIKGEEKLLARYVLFDNDNLILTTLNREYKKINIKKENVIVLGKIKQVITNI